MKYKVIEKPSGNIFVVKQAHRLGKGDKLIADDMDAIQARKKQESVQLGNAIQRKIERLY